MKSKKILLQLDSDRHASSFDAIAAYEAGVDQVLSFGGVGLDDLPKLVYGAVFTRSREALRDTAIYIGGSSVPLGEAMLKTICEKIFFDSKRVSVMADPNGSNTTAAAAVVKIGRVVSLSGKRAVVLAGSGPVGVRTAALLAKEGCHVALTSRRLERAQEARRLVRERFGLEVEPVETRDEAGMRSVLQGADIALGAGAAGAALIHEDLWASNPTLEAVVDTNAVPPLGIGGVDALDNGALRHGKLVFGALAVGLLKMKIHLAALASLFERNDRVLDLEELYEIGKTLE
ncbi:MAG: methylenetetrahydrofolate dehydrogenase [Anaerolineae bacterium]|nr:methylenetetrahydrofolate dehydrogenase [Anaerolineae bacterium]